MIVYKETPISELPDKNGFYFCKIHNGDMKELYYENGMFSYKYTNANIISWLKPIDLSSIIEEQAILFARWLLENSYMNGTVTYMKMTEGKEGHSCTELEMFNLYLQSIKPLPNPPKQ